MSTNRILKASLVLALGAVGVGVAVAALNLRTARLAGVEMVALQTMLDQTCAQRDALQEELRLRVALPSHPFPTRPPLPEDSVVAPADDTVARELEQRDAEIAGLRSELAELQRQRQEISEPRAAWTNRMQAYRNRMREQNPEEFERRRQEGRERLEDLAALTRERIEFMKSVPVDGLAPEYLENHKALIERMEFFNTAMEKMAANPEGPETMELMPQIFGNLRGLDEMLSKQREVLLNDLACDIGYEGDAARQFVETVNMITEVTTLPTPLMFRRGRGATPPPLPAVQQP